MFTYTCIHVFLYKSTYLHTYTYIKAQKRAKTTMAKQTPSICF